MPPATAKYRMVGVEHAAMLIAADVANESQSVTITGDPTGGDFTLTYAAATTAAIAYDAAAATVQAALEALAGIAPGDIGVVGDEGGPWIITFNTASPTALTASGVGLTGGTTPGVTIASEDIIEQDLHFINSVGFDTITNDIDFEGDNQVVRRVFLNGIQINVRTDTYDLAAISKAFNKIEVTTIPGVAGRTYMGDTDETAGARVGFVAQIRAENLVTGLNETLRLTCPVARLNVIAPPALAYNSKGVMELVFVAEKTNVQIDGSALPGVPTEGCYWMIDRITD
jgi:hypothetical protein